MSFNILSCASKRSKNAIRGSRTSIKTRVKVDELENLRIYWLLLKNYSFFIDSLIFLFFLIPLKTCIYMNMACRDCLRAFNMKNITLEIYQENNRSIQKQPDKRMDRVNKPHSKVGHYRIKMCAAFMKSCLQAGATLVETFRLLFILAYCSYSGLLQAGHLHYFVRLRQCLLLTWTKGVGLF